MGFDWETFLTQVELRNFPFPVYLFVQGPHVAWMPGRVCARFHVPDRDTGNPSSVTHVLTLSPVDADDNEGARDVLFDALLHALRHELREAFHVEGVRVFDPHVPEKDGSGARR